MQRLCRFIYKLIGWKIIGALPPDKKFIIIVAPHTSNWDFPIGLGARFIEGRKVNFLAKKQLFFFPLGLFLKAVGGIPIDRAKKGNTVEQVSALFGQSDALILAITPEGTRGPVTRWKEGFYHIACKAQVPLVMLGPDYSTKEIRIEPPFWPSGDIAKDLPIILEYFRTIKGCYPKEIPNYVPKNAYEE
jgi:1-acyl-sn-glycerol-3-phosphate acyltransferase